MKTQEKRLTYVINKLTADDTQHFVHIPNLLSEMQKLGWNINILSERGGKGTDKVFGHPVKYLSLNERWRRLPLLAISLLRLRLSGGRLVFVRISKSAAFISSILGRVFGWRTLFWISGAVEDFNAREKGMKAKIDFAGMWLLLRLVDRLVTGPETMVNYYSKIYGLPNNKIILLYNDLKLSSIQPSIANKQCIVKHVLLVHRLSPVRETTRYFPELIQQLNKYCLAVEKVILHIIGDGPERSQLESITNSATGGLEVKFYGAIPNRELGDHYSGATIFIMPSYREGFPRVILEAMARGLPIVSTDAGGTKDLVGPMQKSFIIDRNDPTAFASSIIQLLEDSKLRGVLKEENLQTIQKFSTPAVAAMYDNELTKIIPEMQK